MVKLGIDLDGVVFDIQTPLLSHYNQDYDDDMTIEDWKHWRFEDNRFKCGKLTWNYLHDPRIQFEAPVYDYAPEALGELINMDDVDVTFVTATARSVVHAKVARLETMLPSRTHSYGFFFGGDKTRVDCDLYIEDSPSQVWSMLGAGRRVLVFDQPWNRELVIREHEHWHCEDMTGAVWQAIRVKHWKEVPRLVSELKEMY